MTSRINVSQSITGPGPGAGGNRGDGTYPGRGSGSTAAQTSSSARMTSGASTRSSDDGVQPASHWAITTTGGWCSDLSPRVLSLIRAW